MLTKQEISAYQEARSVHSNKLCHAPFTNLYFNTEGHVAVCWLTFYNPVIYDESKSLKDIWHDVKFQSIREHIGRNDLSKYCQTCEQHLKQGNHVNVLAKAYDTAPSDGDYPSIIEFELENTCNLACTMCNGLLSSTIRKDREGKPPLKSPYGKKFREDLKEFIPHLSEARFNGGEPFLIQQYWPIWEDIMETNPSVKMTMATNGSVLNSRVKDILTRGNIHLNISMDGFSKETYESIRVGGNFDRLMKNLDYFISFCAKHNRTLCIMVNPLRQNWWEMPDFVNWVNAQNIRIWFNSIIKPEDQSLWALSPEKLQEVYDTLKAATIKPKPSSCSQEVYEHNVSTYTNLIHNQIHNWLIEARRREESPIDSLPSDKDFVSLIRPHLPPNHDFFKLFSRLKDEQKQALKKAIHPQNVVFSAAQMKSMHEKELQEAIDALVASK